MIDTENEDADNIMGKMFGRGAKGEPTDEDTSIFDSIEELLQDDAALNFVTNRVNIGMDHERIRGILLPFIGILKSRGVEMFSGGDEARKEVLQAKMNSVNSYASIINEFWPLLKNIFEYIKEGRQQAQLADDDWDDMLFEESPASQPIAQQQPGAPQQPNGGQIDPNFISPPQQATAQAYGAGRAVGKQPPKGGGLGMTWESILNNHQAKFGSRGLNKVVNEIESKTNAQIDMEFDDAIPVQNADGTIQHGGERDGPDINKMTMKELVAKHATKFGSDDSTAKVRQEMRNAGLDTNGLDFTPNNGNVGQGLDVTPSDERDMVYDEDDEGEIKLANSNPAGNSSAKRARMDVMPQSGLGVPNSLYNDDRDDWDDEY